MKPGLEALCYLTKFSEDNNYVNEKAIFIFHRHLRGKYVFAHSVGRACGTDFPRSTDAGKRKDVLSL